jgi:hypothetical protein
MQRAGLDSIRAWGPHALQLLNKISGRGAREGNDEKAATLGTLLKEASDTAHEGESLAGTGAGECSYNCIITARYRKAHARQIIVPRHRVKNN